MKSAKIVRPIDSNGRVVLPKHLLTDILNIKNDEKPYVEFFYNDDSIIIKKFKETCDFCSCESNLIDFKDKKVCTNCLKELQNIK